MARLDGRCELRLFSVGGPDFRRTWIAEVHRRHRPAGSLQVSAPSMREALLEAVGLAEARGWSKSEQMAALGAPATPAVHGGYG